MHSSTFLTFPNTFLNHFNNKTIFLFLNFSYSASCETIDISGSNLNLELGIKERLDNLDQANTEIDRLRKIIEKLTAELQGNERLLISD
jgi:hypothetical protein